MSSNDTTMRERQRRALPGYLMLFVGLGLIGGGVYAVVLAAQEAQLHRGEPAALPICLAIAAPIVAILVLKGLFVVNPNEAAVLQLFGRYVGTVRTQGLRWTNPFYTKTKISLRVRSFDSERLKVNDIEGNPIEIAAIVVWRVADTAEALFNVDDYQKYVRIQTEAALRNLATRYPYDSHDDAKVSLRGHTAVIAQHLREEILKVLASAGIEVVDARISHLAYAPEIAQAMLQRQQAGAIIAARQRIVEGAVGMVEMALALLAKNNVVALDEERKAQMVSNLLVVLCGERATQPVVNTGTIYQ
jgi:regulator of protease activity HflC (stomatin/prohibitin superfamily)